MNQSICSFIKRKLAMFGFFDAPVGQIKITTHDEPDTLMNEESEKSKEKTTRKDEAGMVDDKDRDEFLDYWDINLIN